MTTPIGQPAYQRVADDLRRKIATGELPVGSPIPSTARLTEDYGVSSTVVRAAVARLRIDGLVVGQAGKGVFVQSTPEAAAERTASIDDLANQVNELRSELREVETAGQAEVVEELARLRQHVGLLHAHLIDLYARLGQPYPYDSLSAISDSETPAERRERQSGT